MAIVYYIIIIIINNRNLMDKKELNTVWCRKMIVWFQRASCNPRALPCTYGPSSSHEKDTRAGASCRESRCSRSDSGASCREGSSPSTCTPCRKSRRTYPNHTKGTRPGTHTWGEVTWWLVLNETLRHQL